MCVYPVPIKGSLLFLGIHSTITCNGLIKIGPSAIPSLSLENYRNIENINLFDIKNIF